MAIGASERRIIELVLKATGSQEIKKIQSELSSLRQTAEASQASLDSLSSGFSLLGKGIAAVGGLALVTGAIHSFVGAASEAINTMDDLSVQVSKVGVAAEDLQKLQYAANLSNTGLDSLNTGLTKLSKNLVDLGDKNSAATETLRKLGVTADTGAYEAMKKLADLFQSMPDGPQKTAIAIQQFGKAGAELIPILNGGSEGLEEMGDEAVKLGGVLSGEALAAANTFNDQIDKLTTIVEGAVKQIVGGMLPALVTLAEALVGASTTGTDFASVGKAIGDAMIYVVAEVGRAIVYIQAFGKAVEYSLKAASAAAQGMGQSLKFQNQAAELNFKAAGDYGKAAKIQFQSAGAQGDAFAARMRRNYQQVQKDAKAAGEALGKVGGGKLPSAAAGGGGGGKAGGGKGGGADKDGASSADRAADKEILDRATDAADAWYKAKKELSDYVDKLNEAADPNIAYKKSMDELEAAQATGKLSAEAYRMELERITETRDKATASILANTQAEKDRVKEQDKQKQAMEDAQKQWGFIADAAGRATQDIIEGTESIGRAIKRMVATIIAEFVRMQLVAAANKILGGLLQGAGVSLFSAGGNMFGSSGVITAPTAHGIAGGGIGIAGEKGPEAILPLTRTASGDLGVATTGGGGSGNVTVNNYAGADVGVTQTDQGLQIDIMRRQIADDIRRGGNSVSSALEGTYGVGRYAGAYR